MTSATKAFTPPDQRSPTGRGVRRALLTGLALLATLASLVLVTPSPAHAITVFKFIVRHSGKCMDVAGSSTAHMADVIQQRCEIGKQSQYWEARRLNDGSYLIVNQNSGRCLDVAWASTAVQANVIQATCSYADNQRWWLPAGTGSGFQEVRAKHSNMCLDVAWVSPYDGADILQSSCWNGTNQQWRLSL